MSTTQNPYDNYKSHSVMTASKEELTLMLYEGAIKFCNQARVHLEKNDTMKSHENIMKVQNILKEFLVTLDMQYEISTQLAQIYGYLHQRLMEANAKKDPKILKEVQGHLRELRDTWKEAMKLAKDAPEPVASAAKPSANAEAGVKVELSGKAKAAPVAKPKAAAKKN